MIWEYETEVLNSGDDGLHEQLARLGAQGWEMVQIVCREDAYSGTDVYTAFFKRPAPLPADTPADTTAADAGYGAPFDEAIKPISEAERHDE